MVLFQTLSLPDDEMMTDEKDQEDDSEDLMSIEDQHVDSGMLQLPNFVPFRLRCLFF